MKLLFKRKKLSINFATICFSILVFTTSIMMSTLYSLDRVVAEVTAVDFKVEDGSNKETISIKESIDLDYHDFNEVDIVMLSNIVEETKSTSEEINLSVLHSEEYLPVYKYGERIEPSIKIPNPISKDNMRNNTDEVDTSEYLYIGTYDITGYTPKCYHCCGSTKGITASGVEAIVGYTVAADKSIPFGTTLYIEGYGYYIVEDRGNLEKNVIDIAAPDHGSCYDLTNNGVNVYVVPLNK